MSKEFCRLVRQDKLLAGTESALAKKTGINRNTLHYWLANEDARPSYENLVVYTENMDCRPERKLDYFDACGLPAPPELLAGSAEPPFTQVPVIGFVHAGHTAWSEQETLGTMPVENDRLKDADEHFFLVVEGDCMNRLIPEGALALVSQDRYPINGNTVVVAREEEEHMIRRYFKRGGTIRLVPESFNEEHVPLEIREDDFKKDGWKIIGVVTSAVIEL